MSTYRIGLKNELYKLSHKRKTYWIFGILMVLSVISILVLFGIRSMTAIEAIDTADTMTWILRQMSTLLLPLFTAMFTVDLFIGEGANETLKNTLLMPIERYKVYLAKISAVAVMVGLMLLSVYVVSALCGIIFLGLNDFGGLLWSGLLAYLATTLPLMVMAVIISFLALWTKSASGTLTVGIVLYIAINLIGTFVARLAIYLPTSYMQWYRYPVGSNTFVQMLLFMVAYIIMFLSISMIRFDSKEV